MSDRINRYAEAFYAIAAAEGDTAVVEDELFRFAQALEANDSLRVALADPSFPAGQRQQVVEDLLKGKASSTTVALVSMAVGAGRAGDLPEIVRALVDRAAATRNRAVAEVRSAVPLSADQSQRLAAALKQATGKDVDIKVVIDPSVLGGIVTQIGDTVIDGSVRTRIEQLKSRL